MSWRLDLFSVKAVHTQSLVVDKRGIENVILNKRAAQAAHTERLVLITNSSTPQQDTKEPKARSQSAQCKLNTVKAKEAQQGNAAPEYTVDRIGRHVLIGDNIRCAVWWFGCTS